MIAITGAPGTGKTTYANSLGLKVLHTDDFLHHEKQKRAAIITRVALEGGYEVIEGTLVPWVLRFMLYASDFPVQRLVIMQKVHKRRPGTEGLAGAINAVLLDIERDLRKKEIVISYGSV